MSSLGMKKLVYIVGAGVVLLIALIIYFNTTKNSSLSPLPPFTNTVTITPFVVPFEYEIVSITPGEIKLAGEKGELVIPNNPESVRVFAGTSENQILDISALQMGQKVKVELIPGVSAKIFILP